MKRLLLISTLCLTAIGVVAQQNDTTTIYNPNLDLDTVIIDNPYLDADTTAYHPFVEEGKVWKVAAMGVTLDAKQLRIYTMSGDTVIGEYNCKKWSWEQTDCYGTVLGRGVMPPVFEANKKVFFIPNGTEKPFLYYDFGLAEGDTITVYDINDTLRTCELSVVQTFWSDDLHYPQSGHLPVQYVSTKPMVNLVGGWIQGVGFLRSLEPSYKPVLDGRMLEGQTMILYCAVGNDTIFRSKAFFQIGMENFEKAYRPLVERGKVWRTAYGPDVENAHNFYEYRFLENVTVDGKECYLLGRSELAFNEGVFYPIDTICVGALYEEGQKVYVAYAFGEERRYGYFNSNYFLESPVLLYDFASPVGTEIKLLQNGPVFSYIIADKSKGLSSYYQDMYNMTFNGNCTFVGIKLNENIIEDVPSTIWLEGVGSRFSPLDNIYDLFQYGYMAERLLTCSVGDETLYMKGDLNSIWPDNDVKKQWLDFTHTVKPRPKAPRRSESVEAGEEEESLTGEYSARELFVNLKTLDGAYTVTMRNSQSEEVYRKEVQTSNIVALSTDLTKYAKGTYTLVIENDAESYTATLTIGDEDGITSPMANAKESMFNVQWLMFNGIYDLTGRRLTSRPAKGLYIENQKLKVR